MFGSPITRRRKTMQSSEFKARVPDDPRLAVHATSPLPAWLWSVDGTRVLWANPPGALVFRAANGVRLAGKVFGPADPHRRQIAQLAHRLLPNGAVRLERLRGFGSVLNTLVTCACARLEFADGNDGVLIVATEPGGRTMPLTERLQKLVEEADGLVATFESDGARVAASDRADFYGLHHLTEAGLDEARQVALKEGRAEAPLGSAHITLTRLGNRTDTGLFAVITPAEIPAVADELPTSLFSDAVADDAATEVANATAAPRAADPQPAEPVATTPHGYPMRFMWQMDAEGRFSLGSDAFTRLIGVHTAAGFGRPWTEIADVFGLDPEGLVVKAIATRESWSGIIVNWPAGDGSRLPVELSGLPIHDAAQNFVGYRGFGVCRDVDGLSRLDMLRSQEFFNDPPSADMMSPEIGQALAGTWIRPAPPPHIADTSVNSTASISSDLSPDTTPSTDQDSPVDTPNDLQEVPAISPNVVPFRPLGETRSPVLTPVENSAFDELARQLSARLEGEAAAPDTTEPSGPPQALAASPTEADVQPSQA